MDRLTQTVASWLRLGFVACGVGAGLVLLALAVGRVWPGGQLAYWTEYPVSAHIQMIDLLRNFTFTLDSGEMPAWSPDGRQLAYISSFGRQQSVIVTDIYSGHFRAVAGSNWADIRIDWSPDGRQLVYDSFEGSNWDIFTVDVCEVAGCDSTPHRLTQTSALDARPAWSPDGTQIAFLSTRTGRLEIFVMNADGSDSRRLTQNSNAAIEAPQWSPDGSKIMFSSQRADNLDIFVMDSACGDLPDGCEGHVRNLTRHPAQDSEAAWSPDGEWVAFTSRRDGNFEIYLVPVDGSSPPRNLSNYPAEDRAPVWSPDGRWIAFQSNRDKLYNDEIYVLEAATGEQRRVTASFGSNQSPVWWPG